MERGTTHTSFPSPFFSSFHTSTSTITSVSSPVPSLPSHLHFLAAPSSSFPLAHVHHSRHLTSLSGRISSPFCYQGPLPLTRKKNEKKNKGGKADKQKGKKSTRADEEEEEEGEEGEEEEDDADSPFSVEKYEGKFERSFEHFKDKLAAIQVEKASTSILDDIVVKTDAGTMQVSELGSCAVSGPRTLQLIVFDPNNIPRIGAAIEGADLGLTTSTEGVSIHIRLPKVTTSYREGLVKQAKALAEQAKQHIKTHRRDALDAMKKAKLPKDDNFRIEKEVQDVVNKYNKLVTDHLAKKEKSLLA